MKKQKESILIEVNKEDLPALLRCSDLMSEQNSRGTRNPIFVIQDKVKSYVDSGWDWDERERKEDMEEKDLCQTCLEEDRNGEILDQCDDWRCADSFNYFKWKIRHHGHFLTELDCDNYISRRSYALGKDPKSYAYSARDSEELCAVQRLMCSLNENSDKNYR